jgi:hypothetical protein
MRMPVTQIQMRSTGPTTMKRFRAKLEKPPEACSSPIATIAGPPSIPIAPSHEG